MSNVSEMIEELKRKRDELRLQMNLASKDAEQQWHEFSAEWDKFLEQTQFEKSREEVGEAARELGHKLKDAYDRFKNRNA